jgi:hypothetical protein
MYTEKNNARNKLGEALIADYQNRISDIERQEKEDEWRNKEWDYKLSRDAVADERYADELKYSRDRDTIADKRYEDELAYSRNRDTVADKRYEDELAYSRGRDTIADKRYEDELAYSRGRDTIADKRYEDELAYSRGRDDVADKRYADELAYARGRDAIADARYADETAYSREQDALNRAFAEQQWQTQQEQWREEFNYNKMTNDQKIAFEVITAALAAGNDADDATLKRAGISRAEFNTMKQKAAATGTGGTPYWKSLGFASEKDYSAARKLGMNADQYKAYLAGQNGGGNGNDTPNDGTFNSELKGYVREPLTTQSVGVAKTGTTSGKSSTSYEDTKNQILATTKNSYLDKKQTTNSKK